MNSLLTALQSMLRRRAAHLFITLGAGLALAVIATFAWGGVSADSLGKFGITEQSRVGQLIKRLAPKAKLSPAGKAALFATLTVTSGADSGSTTLRGRIASAVAGDTIVFSGVTTVTLTSGELLIDKDLTINGGTNGVTITRSSGTFRIFNISTGTVSMSKLTITNGNNGSGQAGGVQNNGTLTMTDCAVTGNTSVQGGGIQNDSVLTMTNCTISGNTSTGPGGGLESFGTTTSLTNCTISGNSASSNGGAFSMDAGNLNLTNCTVANNTAGTGGGLYVPGGTHLLKNTIVASNTAATSNNISGTVSSSSSYNLIGIGGTGGLTNGTNGNQINVSNPLLDVLASNGGYTQTIALLSGSPALDKGAAVAGVTTDQRGQTRPFDLPSIAPATSGDDSDIGAYEMQVTCNTVTVNPSTLPNGTIGVGYTQTLTASGGTAPYTFAVTAGTLPAGLTLASDGSLSGIPTAAGAASFTITASYTTFGISCTGSRAYTMTIGSCPAAVSFTVNNTGDTSDTSPGNGICSASGGGCTLRAAIEEINALSACTNTINFSVSGTINLTAVGNSTYGPSALVINRNITINGNGIVLQRASGVTRLRQFYVSPYGNLTLNQVTLQNGVALGGNGGNGNANGNGENAGAAAGLGGAIFNEGTLTINRSTLTANLAQGGNGGSSTVFVGPAGGAGGGGMGGDGGGGGGTNGGDGGTPNGGTGSTTSNTAGGSGGAGGGGGGGKGSANGGNGGFGGGGGASGSGGFGGNGGFGSGGGSGSSAGGGHNVGGFGANDGGGNTAGGGGAGLGGAVFNNYQGIITITNSTLSGNTVTGGTGGLNQTTFGSVAFALGSGLFNRNGTVTIVSSTFNDSIYNLGASNTDTSGGTTRSGASMTIDSTIISTCSNNSGTVTGPLANKNLIQNNSGCDTPALTGNPMLAPLGNYGGSTPTHALLAGSPAIDAGDNSVTGSPYNLTTDQTGQPRQANGTVDIGAYENQLSLSPVTLPNAQVSVAYNQTITASGGTPTYTFAVTSGSLPTGLSLSSGGVLSGTPSSSGGPFSFVVTATDSGGKKGSRQYNTVTICGTLSATPASLTNATFGNGYSQLLTGTGGTAPYTFAVTGGALPSGMTLTQSGTLQGSPVIAGTSNFTVTITDVNGCFGTKAYALVVDANACTPAAITVTSNADSGTGSLRQAITDICGGGTITIQSGLGTISLSTIGNSAFGPTALGISNKAVIINGNGATIERLSGVTNLRLFYIDPTGYLNLQNVTLQNGLAKGGNGGGGGGGGGGGLGGAIVNQGNLTVQNSTLTNNQALGGNGSASSSGGGGGGGMGFNGGSGGSGGGGGGGRDSVGANSGSSAGGAGGGPSGGGGANGTAGTGASHGAGGVGNTGGGGGGTSGSASGSSGNGGAGGFGGGGGGAGSSGFGLAIGTSGVGGFGGGGGGGGNSGLTSNAGAAGGFAGGGGGGGNGRNGGAGGFAGGSGGDGNGTGGGGGGLGGGIFNYFGSVTLINSTLSGNTAQGGNGGNGTTTGSAGGCGFGGSIFNYNGAVTVVAATLSNNTVTGGTNGTPAPATSSDAGGGGIYNLGDGALARLSVVGSILANTGSSATDCASGILNSGTTSITGNNSLIENNNACGSPALTADPNLGTLADNGGFTFTHALMAGSPAINAGDNSLTGAPYNLTTDQRGTGFTRNAGGTVDIGAYEVQPPNTAPTITAQAGLSRQQGSPGSNTQIATVNDTESGAAGVTVTVTSLNPANGVTVSNIVNTNGTITADISADCTATNASFTLQANDGSLMATATLNVAVTTNTAPTLSYNNASVNFGNATTVSPDTGPSDNGSVSTITVQSVTPSTAPATITVDSTTGVVTVPNNVPAGSYTVTIRVTDNCSATTDATFTLTVNALAPTLGNYSTTTVTLGAQATVTPDAAPTNTTSITAKASSGFNGTFDANPATGVVKIINAHPAGTFTVTVTACGAGGSTTKTCTLTVQSGTACATTPLFSSAPNLSVGSPYGPAVGDFNNDGKQDLAIANNSSATVSIRLGDGAGGFSGTTTVSTGNNPFAIAVGDFNGDGNQDLAVACTSGGLVSIRLGDGAGNFSGTTNISAGSTAKSVAVGDFNGDGKLDFVTANFGADTASVRFGDGAGGFTGSTNVSVGDGPGQVRVGDFDGDGDLDFATSNQNAGTVSVRLNDGAGNFSGTTEITAGANPEFMALGDFNQDGRLDFVTSNQNAGTLSVRFGDGAGSFTGTTNPTVSSSPRQVLAGDFNNDGNPDIAVKQASAETVNYLLGDGLGGFAAPVSVATTGAGGSFLALGDFNGDGRQDFVTTDFNAGLLAVRLGGCNVAPTIMAGSALTRQQGSAGTSATIATVSDTETAAGSLTVTATTVPTGISVTGIGNTSGTITATVAANCNATPGANSVVLAVTDGNGAMATANLTVNVTANTAPTLTYGSASVNAGAATSNSPTTASDNGSITGYAVQSQGTYTGTISVNSSGVVSLSSAAPVGTHTITIRATDNCTATADGTFTLTVGNNAPTILAGAALTRQRGTAGSVSMIATANDGETAAGSLTVTATTVPAGLTITGITNTSGTITANVAADCTATLGANTIVLTVMDGNSGTATANLTVNVSANTAPALIYSAASVNAGASTTNSPTTATDNGSITGYAVQSQGTFTGTMSVNSSGVVSISNAAPVGMHTITIRATDNCATTTDAMFTLTVGNNPPMITPAAALTRQRGTVGSVSTIATVSDGETAAGGLVVTATTVPTGITVTSITNTTGTIMATVAADCTTTLGANTIVLTVTDGNSGTATANLTVNVTANTAPTLTYAAAAVSASSSTTNSPTAATDNGSITGYTVQNAGTYTGTITVNASGVVSISNATPVGMHTITIRATDNCGVTTDATFTLTVSAANTTTTITNAAALAGTPTVVGEAYAVNVSVTAGAGTPSGTVTVSDGSQSCTITLPATSCNLTSTTTGAPKTLTASYGGDASFNASSGTASHTVNKANTTTTISNAGALGTATVVGQSYAVNWSVTVNAPGALGVALTGNVTVDAGGGNSCTAAVSAGTCNITSTTAGAKSITATYAGDTNYNGSASSSASHTVNAANTTTTITNSGALGTASTVGQAYAVNWSVTVNSPGAVGAALTGNVTVSDGSQTCTAAASAGTCNLTSTTAGAKTITAMYAGDSNYNTSTSSGVPHTVNGAATTTTISNEASLANTPTVVGQSYSVSANVTVNAPGMGTPGGTVNVSDGTGATCMITLSGGTGSCNLTSTTVGTPKTITASYVGDTNFATSSTTASHTVNKANTTASIFSDAPDPSVVGQNVTVTYNINATSPGGGTPTGNVLVTDGVNSCTGTVATGQCVIALFTPGVRTLTATYQGDANYNASPASTGAGHQINKADTTTTITADTPDPSVFGGNVTVNFTVAAAAPGSGTPTGNVIVTVSGGTETCTSTVAAGTCTLALTGLGNRTLTATYQGDTGYNGSASAGALHTVNKADTVTTIVSDNPDSSAVSQNVTVVFTVVATAPGAGTPSGNVVVTASGGAETCTGTVAAGSCVISLTAPGSRTLTATYAGDTNFNGGTDTEPHTVVAPPALAKAFSPASVPVNQISTLTFTITNPAANTVALTGVGFTDTFPNAPNLVVANPPNPVLTNCGGGVLTDDTNGALTASDPGVKLSGATVATGVPCTVSVNVTPLAQGPFVNISGNVSSTNGGTGNTATATLLTNTPPTISSNNMPVKAGSNAASFTIATAFDPDQSANTLGITINGNPTTASSNGVTVSSVTITSGGGVTANITTTCAATTATFALIVTDNQNVTGTGTLTVTVTPNTPPVLSYNAATVTAGTTPTFLPVAGPSDNGAVNPLVLQGVAPNNGGLVISLNAATGQVTVLSAALIGNYTVTVTATDNCGATTTATLPITVVCPTITVNPASLPGATVNTAYAQSLTASPAGGNYTFAVTSGLLPAGLTLNANGSFSGAPTQSGTFNFRLTASGFGGCTGFRDYTLVATCPTITLTPASLPGGTVGTAYSQAVSASPAGSYSYAVSSGALPTGLTLNASTGAITGTPTTNGSFTFTIRASAGACNGSSSYSVTIACPTITLGALANGQAGISYSQTISVSPAGSYTFAILTGNLPSGLSLNTATGVISGLPTVTGTYSFTLRAQTAGGCNGTQSYALVITCPTVTLSPASLPNGTVGTAYSQSLAASPAGGNYTYAVTSGALPAGLSLNLATGLLSGTPSSSGTFTFRITASGFGGCTGFRDYTLVISGGGCPTITLPATLPNGGVGTLYNNSVAASPSGSYSYTATGSLPPGVTLYGSGLLFGYPTTPGSYTFTITATQGACTGTQSYTVLVSAGAFAPLDFDGDRKSELLTRQGNAWTLTLSQSGLRETYTLGEAEDQAAFGDYDGDGRVDLAVYCPTAAHWLIRLSSTGVTITRQLADLLPSATLLPVTADFDGDGITDLALFDAATAEWQVERSHDGKRLTWQFGAAADVPVAADYDGDGKADLAVYQRATGTWLIRQSSDGVELNRQFGGPKDQPLPGDYDGDGKADLAVWRTTEATLYLSQSATQQMTRWAVGLSSTNDWVLPGDFDGDGKLELAVWRGAVGTWFIWQSATQDYRLVVWGTTAAPFRN